MEVNLEVTLNGKRFVQELLVVISLDRGQHKDTFADLVLEWPGGSAKHLKHFTKRIIQVAVLSAFKKLSAHDNDKMRGAVKLPANVSRCNQNLDCTIIV
jgi:hypothetical protein